MKNNLLTITVFSLLLSALSCPVPAHAQPAEQSILMERFPLSKTGKGDYMLRSGYGS